MIAAALLALLAQAEPAPGTTAPAKPIRYAVNLRVDPETQTIVGRASLEGADAPLRLTFSEGYAFKTLEPRLVGELSATVAGAKIEVERESPFAWRLDGTRGGPIDLAWTVKLDHREHPDVIAATDGYEQPYVDEAHGMIFTAAVLPIPALGGAAGGSPGVDPGVDPSVDVEIEIAGPDGWSVVAPWPDVPNSGHTYRPSLDALRDDIVLVGDWKVSEVNAGGLAATFAFAPSEEWLEPLVKEQLGPIVEAEIALFGGAPQPKYLFVFGSSGGVPGLGGSPKTNSMTLFVGKDLPESRLSSGISHLVAHEFHHTWMRSRCQPEDDLRFVAEGYTDYYAYLVSWRLGFLSRERFKAILEEKIAKGSRALGEYGGSLAAAGGPEFFLGRSAYDACYAGGLTMALWTDIAIRSGKKPRSLDGFMRAFYGDKAWDDGTRPDLAHWKSLLESWLGAELAAEHMKAVEGPGDFDLVALFAAIDTPVDVEDVSAGNSPRANFDGATLRQLDPTGPAALAGLHARDRLLSVNGMAVKGEGDVRKAWRKPIDGRLVVVFERDGVEKTLDVPEPTIRKYTLADNVLSTLAR